MGKPILLILISCLLVVSEGRCQLSYGVKGGLNISDVVINNYMDPDVESDYNPKTGLHAGLFVLVKVDEKFLVSAEAMYSEKGVRSDEKVDLQYITVVALAHYLLGEKFLLEGGPELGYLFSARSPYGNVGNVWNNKIDIGAVAGIRYLISETIGVGVRYGAGFSSVIEVADKSNPFSPGESIRYQNRTLQMSFYLTVGRKDR